MGDSLKLAGAALLLALACANPAHALSTEPEKPQTASISIGAEFASGSYGTGSTIGTLYLPLIVTWSPNDRMDLGIELPFIYQSSSAVTTGLYNAASLDATAAQGAAKGGPGGKARASGSVPGEYGLGDIVLRLGVVALAEDAHLPQLHPSLVLKCPTAAATKGLGTGEFDVGAGLEASKWLGDWYLAGEGFFTYQGKAEGFGLNDYWSFTSAAGYQLSESLRPMLLLKGATPPSSFSGGLLEARARLIWSLSATTSLDLYGSRGLAEASPDWGGGLSFLYSF